MGKYSKALEKAKDKNIQHADQPPEVTAEQPLQNEAIEEQPVEAVLETISNQVTDIDSVESQPLELQENKISESFNEMEGWDVKLREIISGNSKQVSENFRMLRSRIFYPESGKPPKSILVTSAIPGEGKSFICANLGWSIAQSLEKQALLVECDLRRPSLSKLLGLPNSRGLVDYLQSGTPIDQLIQQTSIPNLSVLSSGKPPKNPAELIDSKKMNLLFEDLENQNPDQFFIFDSPPMQAAPETDVLAKKVDKVILVVRWGYARREHVNQLVELIGKEKIICMVFNAFEMSRLESKLQGYYYGYKDYYSSSYSKYYVQQQKPKKKWGRRKSS